MSSLLAPDLPADGPSTELPPPTPEWAKDLIIYEIAPRGFTSPSGPESGTFNSLKEKLPYLLELGINGIWLAGHSLAKPHYFYNIWSQYSNIEPDQIEPSLGTAGEFKALIDEAHRRGIRVFLDVHEHGVHASSSLIQSHPQWFLKTGPVDGMVEFDWLGSHPDLDDWWVKIWTDCVTQHGVDGFRIDLGIIRLDAWARIRRNAATAGHPIVVFEEHHPAIPGVSDFAQPWENTLTENQTGKYNQTLLQDISGFYDAKFGRAGDYRVDIKYADGSKAWGRTTGEQGTLRVRAIGLGTDMVSRRQGENRPDGIRDVLLAVDDVSAKPIDDIFARDFWRSYWGLRAGAGGRFLAVEGKPPSLLIHLATFGHGWSSILLSCHDCGWEGFPLDANPYVAQGSRALFGYSVLFAGMIPFFFSGEEFDATFRPIPWLSPHYLGERDAGKGRWLYGCMLDWNEVDQPVHRAMLEDVRSMIALRKRESDVLAVVPDRQEPKLMAVPCVRDIAVPVPYVRWNDRSAILVAANRNTNQDAHLVLEIPLREIGLAGHRRYTVTNLWPAGESKTHSAKDLAAFACTVQRDKNPRGGLCVYKIEPA